MDDDIFRKKPLTTLEYADDICLLPHRIMDLVEITLDLERKSSRVGLKINTNKTGVPSPTGHSNLPICINGQSIENVDQFVYLGSVVSTDGGTELDVARRAR